MSKKPQITVVKHTDNELNVRLAREDKLTASSGHTDGEIHKQKELPDWERQYTRFLYPADECDNRSDSDENPVFDAHVVFFYKYIYYNTHHE